jgi:serine/threonine protein kinase
VNAFISWDCLPPEEQISSTLSPMLTVSNLFKLDDITNEEIAELCSDSNPQRNVIFTVEGGHTIVKLSETIAVKIGATEREAKNQTIARTLVEHAIAYVPRVHRFFRVGTRSYLVMEFIHGKPFDVMDPSKATSRLMAALEHLSQIRGLHAGPLAGGSPSGLLWSDCFDAAPSNTDEVEEYFNIRLSKYSKRVTLSQRDLILCHLDLADSNILYMDNGAICILDWDSAGFYPQALEFCALLLNWRGVGGDNDLVHRILIALRNSSLYREPEVHLLYEGWVSGQKYWLSVLSIN